ncbi:plastid delta12-fatty acid acetylenase [Tanacetum coccineum]
MGAGGRMSDSSKHEVKDILKRVPVDPPFSLSDLKKAIPAHCFERSVIRSSYYVVHDLIVTYVFYFLANTYIPLLPTPLAYLAWPVYWFCQASILTGLWVIGHECGHHAFSEYQWIDDTVGFILHSALFTPYFSWKYSHRNHHANTNSLDNDEVYIPKRKSKVTYYSKILNNPPGRVFTLVFRLTLGFPLYLLTNISGKKYERFANHFDPLSLIFTDRERVQVLISDLGLLAVFYVVKLLAAAHVSNSCARRALTTIDKDFGFLNRVFHDVTHTHVLHHLISYIPHYHAKEARDAIKPVLGEFYKIDRTLIFKAMWREAKECIYMEPDEGIKHKGALVKLKKTQIDLYLLQHLSSFPGANGEDKDEAEAEIVCRVESLEKYRSKHVSFPLAKSKDDFPISKMTQEWYKALESSKNSRKIPADCFPLLQLYNDQLSHILGICNILLGDGIIVRVEAYGFSDNHLLQHSPHSDIPFIDNESYPTTDFNHIPAPRLFATHYARDLLPATITSCKVVCIYRDPKDVLIWYWLASLESPDKILFLKYKEIKMQPKVGSRKLAVFVGKLFTVEEEERRVVAEIVKLCSFEFL